VLWPTLDQDTSSKASELRIKKAFVNLKGNDPFGQVDGGYITINGLLKQFRVERRGNRTMLYTLVNEEVGRAYMDTSTEPQAVDGLLLLASSPFRDFE
jgi:hypothetical protein